MWKSKIDIAGMMIYRCADDGREIRAWDLPQKIGSMALRRSRRRGAVAGSQACSVGKFDDWQPDVFMV